MVVSISSSRQSLLRQFLIPLLSAVLVIGGSVAFVSRWFADRAADRVSFERMESVGKLIANAPFPLTPQVLNQLKQLSQLEFAVVGFSQQSSPLVSATTIEVPAHILRVIESPPLSDPVTVPSKIRETRDGSYLGLILPSGNKYLLVLERKQASQFLNVSFLLPLITGLLSAIGVGIVATWKASRITRRIGYLKEQVEAIAAGDTISDQAPGPNDDIQSLQTAMRVMSIELADSKRRIAENERSRLIQLLASGLAHELRNHLTGAKLALQTCESDSTDHEAIAIATKQMDLAEQQVRRLLTVQTGNAIEKESPVPCTTLLSTVMDLVRPMANHRQVKLDVFPPLDSESDEWVKLSRLEIQSVNAVTGALLNLVINAMEAAGPNGQIKVDVTPASAGSGPSGGENVGTKADWIGTENVVWRICDNGKGPPDEIASQLFEPFVTSKPEGVGLGLAMCKRVATALGGSISWHRSNDWTSFELVLPVSNPKQETPLAIGKSC